ncbi:MAG TPA: PIN domain-containing protein [Candidatus Nanoarchaeia archaeon]|nr:PIN domain-containing protein [Candidatus Nanoarchaeia archaeon]
MELKYFFDSYAIIEIIMGNKNYEKFKDVQIVTSTIHIAEIYYFLLRTYNKQTAEYWMKNLDIDLMNIIKLKNSIDAMDFKFKHKKEKLSYADCLGYVLAKECGMKFLTGDSKFKDKENVVWVK